MVAWATQQDSAKSRARETDRESNRQLSVHECNCIETRQLTSLLLLSPLIFRFFICGCCGCIVEGSAVKVNKVSAKEQQVSREEKHRGNSIGNRGDEHDDDKDIPIDQSQWLMWFRWIVRELCWLHRATLNISIKTDWVYAYGFDCTHIVCRLNRILFALLHFVVQLLF